MISLTLICVTCLTIWFYLNQMKITNPGNNRNDLVLGIFLGAILTFPPIFIAQQILFSENFDHFHTKYEGVVYWYNLGTYFLDVFIHIGVLEELTKFILVIIGLIIRKNFLLYTFDQKAKITTIFILFIGVSLGFAIIENVMYAYNYQSVSLIIARGFISTTIHITCGIEMGYGITQFLSKSDKLSKAKWLFLAFFIPILIHSTFDTFTKYFDGLAIIYFIVIATLFSYQWYRYRLETFQQQMLK